MYNRDSSYITMTYIYHTHDWGNTTLCSASNLICCLTYIHMYMFDIEWSGNIPAMYTQYHYSYLLKILFFHQFHVFSVLIIHPRIETFLPTFKLVKTETI